MVKLSLVRSSKIVLGLGSAVIALIFGLGTLFGLSIATLSALTTGSFLVLIGTVVFIESFLEPKLTFHRLASRDVLSWVGVTVGSLNILFGVLVASLFSLPANFLGGVGVLAIIASAVLISETFR